MKIFEIGVMKTGTTSLEIALKILNYNHKSWDPIQYKNFKKNIYKPIFEEIDKYESFDDGPWHDIDFRILDEKYPNSKFIILERDNESWIKSDEYHNSPKYNVNNIAEEYLNYEWLNDRDNLIKKRIKFKNEKYNLIKEYFKNRPNDLLVMNIKEGWEPLCKFLGKPIPPNKFPHANKSVF